MSNLPVSSTEVLEPCLTFFTSVGLSGMGLAG